MKKTIWLAILLPIFTSACFDGSGVKPADPLAMTDQSITAATCILGASTIGNCKL